MAAARRGIAREQLHIAIVGAIDEKGAAALVDEVFADLPARADLARSPERPSPASGAMRSSISTCRNRPSVSAAPRSARRSRLYRRASCRPCAGRLGLMTSRLFREVREKRGLAYTVFGTFYAPSITAPISMAARRPRTSGRANRFDVAQAEIRDVALNGLNEEELEKGKTYLIGSYPFASTPRPRSPATRPHPARGPGAGLARRAQPRDRGVTMATCAAPPSALSTTALLSDGGGPAGGVRASPSPASGRRWREAPDEVVAASGRWAMRALWRGPSPVPLFRTGEAEFRLPPPLLRRRKVGEVSAPMPIRRLDPLAHRPHRRGRGDRAAGGGGQGAGRERARRRGEADRGRDRGRRATAHPRSRRRRGMDEADLALSVERHATSKIPDGDLTAIATLRLPRRGAAVDRLGVAARNPHSRARRADGPASLWSRTGARARSSPAPRPSARGSRRAICSPPPRRGSSSSNPTGRRRWPRPTRSSGSRWPRPTRAFRLRPTSAPRSTGRRCGRGRSGLHRAAAPGARRRLRRQFDRPRRDPRGRAAFRPRRPADLQPAERLPAVPVRQRARGARQDARRRAARRLSRFPAPRPTRGRRPLRRMRPARGRRQRPPRESRGALSRRRRWSAASSSAR